MSRVSKKHLILIMLLVVAAGCRETLIHNLSEQEANRLVTRLSTAGIVSERERQPDGRFALTVPRGEVLEALHVLDQARLFREARSPEPERSSIVSTRDDQRFRYERALSREIEATLGALEGVLEVRVHLNLPLTDPLFGRPLQPQGGSGSVVLVVAAGFTAPREEIARLVAGASGIDAARIAVLLTEGAAVESSGPVPPPPQVGQASQPVTADNPFWWFSHGELLLSALILAGGGAGLIYSWRRRRLAGMLRRFESECNTTGGESVYGAH